MPVQRYDEKTQRTVIDGYKVSNIVQVETDKIEQAGAIIDAALTNGGNRVAGLDFLVKNRATAQETALTLAVESARRQAETAAKAAGGQIAELLELTINDYDAPQPRVMMAMARMVVITMIATTANNIHAQHNHGIQHNQHHLSQHVQSSTPPT